MSTITANNNYEIISEISCKIGETNVLMGSAKTMKVLNGLVSYKMGLIEELKIVKKIDDNRFSIK